MTDLGTLGGWQSWAYGINSSGQVVGSSYTADNSLHAFLYSGSTMYDLTTMIDPPAGWTISQATAINDAGQIVVIGSHVYGGGNDVSGLIPNALYVEYESFLLTPVPEPSTLILISLGFVGLLFSARGKR
jgi:probable HAF family extracellular repeat protein